MTFWAVEKIADIQKYRTAGISFDQLAISLDKSPSIDKSPSMLSEGSSVDFCKQTDVTQLHASP